MSSHDFGSVRIHEDAGALEISFPFADNATKYVVKGFRGRWNPNKRLWTIDLRAANATSEDVVATVRQALLRSAPEAWVKALPNLSKAAVTSKRFSLSIGEGGARVGLPPGHKHEYTFKAKKDEGISREGGEWVIPSAFCTEKWVRDVLADVLKDDRAALAKMVDYMAGYSLSGTVSLAEGEAERIGLSPGNKVFADPSFVLKADPSLSREHLLEHPFTVDLATPVDGGVEIKVSFLTGEPAWTALRLRYAIPFAERSARLDGPQVVGKWIRRRG